MRPTDKARLVEILSRGAAARALHLEADTFEKIRRLEYNFKNAASEEDRKRAAREWVSLWLMICKGALVSTKIPRYLLEELQAQGRPHIAAKELAQIGSVLLASMAKRKAGHNKKDADSWALERCGRLDPKRAQRDWRIWKKKMENWRRRVREHSIKQGEDFLTSQSRFDLAASVRELESASEPPPPASSWEEATELIIRGKLKLRLWPPALAPSPRFPKSKRGPSPIQRRAGAPDARRPRGSN